MIIDKRLADEAISVIVNMDDTELCAVCDNRLTNISMFRRYMCGQANIIENQKSDAPNNLK